MPKSTSKQENQKKGYAIIYCRVSTKSQNSKEGSVSLSMQHKTIEDYCESKDIPIRSSYEEIGSARDIKQRPIWRKIMKEAEPGDIIMVYDVSRF